MPQLGDTWLLLRHFAACCSSSEQLVQTTLTRRSPQHWTPYPEVTAKSLLQQAWTLGGSRTGIYLVVLL